MPESLLALALWTGATAGGLFLGAVLLTHLRRLCPAVADRAIRAPLLDILLAAFTFGPWIVAVAVSRQWPAFAGALLGQMAGLILWCRYHELLNREAMKGPRIVKYLNRRVGMTRNHVALWVSAWAVPVFWAVRVAELIVYPLLVLLIRLPRYKQGEWINVSRQKFEGLIGHDLIWCLYCDWMTGVWSLGTEMLRNIESFWCPLRFYDGKKCENCTLDFPDVDGGWASEKGDMQGVVDALDKHFAGGNFSWFGHPSRKNKDAAQLTVGGKPLPQEGGQ